MNKHTVNHLRGQGSQHQSEVLAELCYRFVCPLLQALHTPMDRRLIHTLLDLLPVIVMHRHRNQGLLLSELGGFLLGAEHAPAGTKRVSNAVRDGTQPWWKTISGSRRTRPSTSACIPEKMCM